MLPRITIVTPSFNQAQYLEQTLLSVLDQGYPNLEYFVIDGGSTDGSVDLLRKYSSRLTYWVSERDHGQTHAINKGMARATGDIRAYINSDDFYLPGTLHAIAKAAKEYPGCDLFHGDCRIVDEQGNKIGRRRASIKKVPEIVDLWGVWWQKRNFVQPEVFWTSRIAEKIGAFRESLYFVMDYEYWTRMLVAGAAVRSVEDEWACFRITPSQKSSLAEKSAAEQLGVVQEYLWNPTVRISRRKRLQLQGEWLYQMKFLPAVSASVAEQDSRFRRAQHLNSLVLRHPQMLLANSFWRRVKSVAGR